LALNYDPRIISPSPRMALAVLTCMDTRLSATTLGLEPQDAHFIRNAGGIATSDAIRSLLISHYLLGTREVMVINHTDCGLMKSTDDGIRQLINSRTEMQLDPNVKFHAFQDVEANVRSQLKILDAQIWVRNEMTIRGFVFDVQTGHLREVLRS
jgi:carbonic anhydrase